MKHTVELPAPAIVNRPVHAMAVIVIALFAFHFARLSGFAAAPVVIALLIAVTAAATLGLKRTLMVDTGGMTTVVTLFSWPLRTRRIEAPGIAWAGVRSDLPDLVVEVGTRGEDTFEVQRFRNAYGRNESEAADACSRLAAALQIEDRCRGRVSG